MTKQNKTLLTDLIAPVLLILVGAFGRLLPHPPNVTPLTGIALFGGRKFQSPWMSYGVSFGALFISDLFLGFHSTMPFVYIAFAITVVIGRLLQRNPSALATFGATWISSTIFFVVTNFGVWISQSMYPKTAAGLLMSYGAAIPFYRNMLIGDLVFVGIIFGLNAWIESQKMSPSPQTEY